MRKANGLGDIEMLCAIPEKSLEIGNRVWCDNGSGVNTADNNGIQDPGEAGVNEITVRLTCDTEYAETTSANNGNYLFTAAIWSASANTTSDKIPENTACTVSIDTSGSNGSKIMNACSLGSPAPTLLNATTAPGNDNLRDNDGQGPAGGTITANITTGGAGANNHSIDFGFGADQKVDLSLTKTVNNSTPFRGDTLIYTLTLSNDSDNDASGVKVQDLLPTGITYVSHSGGDYNPVSGIWAVGEVLTNSSKVLTITVKVD